VEKKRIVGLDALRGLAAGAVLLHHHAQYYDVLYSGRRPLPVDLGPGHFGVELFFIISGFVILMTIQRKRTVRDFAISRFTRLMPAFLAALVIACTLLTLLPMPWPFATPTLWQFLANLTMAPLLFGQDVIDLPYWTLTYEMVFYGLMALCLWLGLLRDIEWAGLALIAAGLLFRATMDVPHHFRMSVVLLAYYSNFFLIGICLYRIGTGSARKVTYAALVLSIAMSGLGGGERAFYAPGWLYLTLTLSFTGLVWYATRWPGRWLLWPPLVFLGRVSYPLYLVHVVLGYEIIRFGVEQGWSTLQGVMAAGVASLALATLLHYFIEVPGERWSRSRLQAAPA
jgi:peptidoglycan/LPS O-acetylase OafA/YrhL